MSAVVVDRVDLGAGVLAGFTSRAGGASRPPYDGANLGLSVGDDRAAVRANRADLAVWAGVPVVFAAQVHGTGVTVVRHAPPDDGPIGDADALVAVDATVAVAVLVADCVPVLLADPSARVVAAVHAGRRGLVAGVLQAALATMVGCGARPSALRAVVGPCIAGESYEVPAAMADEVAAAVPGTRTVTAAGTPGVDLRAGVHGVLAAAGVVDVRDVARDTRTDGSLFSHRRDGPATGRFAAVVRLLDQPGRPHRPAPAALRGTPVDPG